MMRRGVTIGETLMPVVGAMRRGLPAGRYIPRAWAERNPN